MEKPHLKSAYEKAEKQKPRKTESQKFAEETAKNIVVESLSKSFLEALKLKGRQVKSYIESDKGIELMDLMEQMLKVHGTQLKIVKKPNRNRLYPVESFSGDKNPYANADKVVVFETDGYQFLQKESMGIHGVDFIEDKDHLAETEPGREFEQALMKAGLNIATVEEVEALYAEGNYYKVVLKDREGLDGEPSGDYFKTVLVRNGSAISKLQIKKTTREDTQKDYYYIDLTVQSDYTYEERMLTAATGDTIEAAVQRAKKRISSILDRD